MQVNPAHPQPPPPPPDLSGPGAGPTSQAGATHTPERGRSPGPASRPGWLEPAHLGPNLRLRRFVPSRPCAVQCANSGSRPPPAGPHDCAARAGALARVGPSESPAWLKMASPSRGPRGRPGHNESGGPAAGLTFHLHVLGLAQLLLARFLLLLLLLVVHVGRGLGLACGRRPGLRARRAGGC